MALKWLPLESNPEVMNQFLRDLGVPQPWGLCDIFSLDVEEADIVPQPCLAVILLLPITKKYSEYVTAQEAELAETLPLLSGSGLEDPEVYFMKQTISNACGTVALIHAVANNLGRLSLPPDSILQRFLDSTKDLSPEERGRKLESNVDIANLHEVGAHEGQSEEPDIDEDVDLHFIALVNIGDRVVELDGRKNRPIVHCSTTAENFLKDTFRVCQKYIAIDPFNLRYNALSLGMLDNY